MTGRGLTFYKQHFFFSNLLVRFLLGFDQYRSRNQQLFLVSTIIVYTLPLIVHQMFQLEANMRNIHELTDCIIYSTGSIFLTYLNFYLGQTLIDNSNAAYKELCQVPYYSLSIKTQKLLLFVITRSGKPSMLSIGGMFVSSHEVFFKMMQKAFSFAMVYYSIQ
ncbi:hypothetical protein M0802_011813 [Mischocyttarus mexicanus]|nr:hypothetical protein M0802_011813 [Mischocyttarus mexicanus]